MKNDLDDLNSYATTENLTPPVAGCLNFTTHEGCAVNDTLNGTSFYDSPLGYSIVSKPSNGVLTLDEVDGFVYKSKPGFIGNDTFTYKAQDMDLDLFSDIGNVTIIVNPDKAPIAYNMTLFTAINNLLNGYLDGSDPDNDIIHYNSITQPLNGTLKLGDDGYFIYTLNDNFTGNDSFTYQTTDNVLNSTVGNVTIAVVEATMPIAYSMMFNIAQNSILDSKFNITGINGTDKLFNILSKPVW
ncbi:MAG: Ig-like domain-containing protein [Methanobacterium sp.]|nr:Ig-like domain-containing protein [Methanobacterium sp.]